MSQQTQSLPPRTDTATEIGFGLVKLAAILAGAVLLLPLLVPMVAATVAGTTVARRHAFWITYRWHTLVNVLGVAVVAAVLAVEWSAIAQWVIAGDAAEYIKRDRWITELLATWWPVLVLNLLLGVLLLPIAWSIRRRQIAEKVRTRTIPSVLVQEEIEGARKRAADIVAARQIGLHLDPQTGDLRPVVGGPHVTAPLPVRAERRGADGRKIAVTLQAFGVITRATVRTMGDRMADRRRIPDWTDDENRYVVVPDSAGAVRVLQLAESGSGKTVLMIDAILACLHRGWPVFFIDAKGDPEDADKLAALARGRGYTVSVGEPWNLFTGTAAEITTKLMRTLPTSTGDGQFYNDEVQSALTAIQAHAPLTGMRDLFTRLEDPSAHVRDQAQLAMMTAAVDRIGTTRSERVRDRLLLALGPLEPHLAASGWSYKDRRADLTIVPLSPSDDAQAKVGDLVLLDLRRYMTERLAARDKSPAVVFVDEFAQLVTEQSDPGDTAGKMFETARSAGLGLWLAAQSVAGLSKDETQRRRALSSGAALVFGRSKDPDDIVKYAGTVMRLEASGAATGEELKSARAQHTFVVQPQDVRQAAIGSFWLVQGGGMATFRALPTPPAKPAPAAPAQAEDDPAAASAHSSDD